MATEQGGQAQQSTWLELQSMVSKGTAPWGGGRGKRACPTSSKNCVHCAASILSEGTSNLSSLSHCVH